jgi:hypothetical protein
MPGNQTPSTTRTTRSSRKRAADAQPADSSPAATPKPRTKKNKKPPAAVPTAVPAAVLASSTTAEPANVEALQARIRELEGERKCPAFANSGLPELCQRHKVILQRKTRRL